jgi:hypothetical protein
MYSTVVPNFSKGRIAMPITKQEAPVIKAAIAEAVAELEALGMLRKTGEFRLSRDGEWQPVYKAVPVN